QDRELDKAKATLQHFGPHLSTSDVSYWTLRFAAAGRDGAGAESAARAFFSDREASGALLEAGRKALTELGWRPAADLLDALVLDPAAPAHVGGLWAEHRLRVRKIPSTWWFLRRASPEVRIAALAATLDDLGERKVWLRAVWVAMTNWSLVRSNPRLFGTMGFVFTN